MLTCPCCNQTAPAGTRFCSSCGAPLAGAASVARPGCLEDGATLPVRSRSSGDSRPSSSEGMGEGRFVPGTVLSGRYRIVALLGRGGMGEVYRADDLLIGQAIALKFLTADLGRDESRLERFLREVRLARHVAHPNVCRVFDVGQVEGLHYLSMEYVDGEDLGSLLRRIGRLPDDKAIQLARQICAGLAAAHDRGIVHRDLKPANIMIDGAGRARITDFGLASLSDEVRPEDVRAGTPLYMAPEQLAGMGVTPLSDIFSLGLVLYEMFTGRRAFHAETAADLVRLHETSTPPSPSTLVRGLDPAVERVILSCLSAEPERRPPSALAVAAGLPGGDPLATALAAGETPSPELLAQAGRKGGLRPAVAWALVAVISVSLGATFLLGDRARPFAPLSQLLRSPDVQTVEAREILETLGSPDPPQDSAWGFFFDEQLSGYRLPGDSMRTEPSFEVLRRRPGLRFWYRHGSDVLHPYGFFPLMGGLPSRVTRSDPPLAAGMARVDLDESGRLLGYAALPSHGFDEGPWDDPNWASVFELAGLDLANFTRATPKLTPRLTSDRQWAWRGISGRDSTPAWVEAWSFRGKPVFFARWDHEAAVSRLDHPITDTAWPRVTRIISASGTYLFRILFLIILVSAPLLARRNLRLGRGDRRGASRLAVFMFGVWMLTWVLGSHHHFGTYWVMLHRVLVHVAWGLFLAGLTWVVYVALEPLLRRRWSDRIVSWVRLLSGRFRDPLVGRDVLIGVGAGAGLWLVQLIYNVSHGWLGLPPPGLSYGGHLSPTFMGWESEFLTGLGSAVGGVLYLAWGNIIYILALAVIVILLRLVLRVELLVCVVMFLILTATGIDELPPGHPVLNLLAAMVVAATFVTLLIRAGVLPFVIAWFSYDVLRSYPFSLDLALWISKITLVALAAIVGLTIWGLRTSLAGQPVFKMSLFGD